MKNPKVVRESLNANQGGGKDVDHPKHCGGGVLTILICAKTRAGNCCRKISQRHDQRKKTKKKLFQRIQIKLWGGGPNLLKAVWGETKVRPETNPQLVGVWVGGKQKGGNAVGQLV